MFKNFKFLAQYWFNLIALRILLFPDHYKIIQLDTFGNHGAQWKVPTALFSRRSICYCAGVGEDISFELGLYSESHPFIFLFDPTPRAISYIKKQPISPKITFYPWGLWSKNSIQKFYAPPMESYVSHSIVNLHQTQTYFEADCKSLVWIMKTLGHTQLDMLKIDIEGAEYMVLEELLRSRIRPKVLAIEFDQPTPLFKTFSMIKNLITAGYILVDHTGWNFIFVYNQKNNA